MLKTCEEHNSHQQGFIVVYEDKYATSSGIRTAECPFCDLVKEVESEQETIDNLNTEVEEQKEEIAVLKQQLDQLDI